jgi:DNA-binding CsgD family transcriptional regulator
MSKYPPEIEHTICERLRAGETAAAVARDLGLSASGVRGVAARNRIPLDNGRPRGAISKAARGVAIRARVLRSERRSIREIAYILGRSERSVRMYLAVGGRK